LGHEVKVVGGEVNNIKITYPQDVRYAQMLAESDSYRIGLGFDVHRFSRHKKKLILGGIVIPAPFGLEAVSDGDVVLHAVADGVCGAAGLGDIGDYFAPQNHKSKGIKSKKIVDTVLADIKNKFVIENIDITIIAQRPKLSPYKKQMLESLKKIFPQIAINVKIKSKEGLDILGGIDSIACVAAILLKKC
jgi:2-C-methyl-D-erythritol 2,4-cyclodiphosphate synthase